MLQSLLAQMQIVFSEQLFVVKYVCDTCELHVSSAGNTSASSTSTAKVSAITNTTNTG
jgi:hypothetical protein